MNKLALSVFLIAFTGNLQGSFQSLKPWLYHAVVVPGQNGHGWQYYLKNGVVVTESVSRFTSFLESCELLGIDGTSDLGQEKSMKHFQDQWDNDIKGAGAPVVIACASEGTATVVNSVAQWTDEAQKRIKALILDAVLDTGDNAIMHSAKSMYIGYLPFARWWGPKVAQKWMFPDYKSSGPQLIDSIQKISPEVATVMIHDKNDFQLSVNGARRAYLKAISRPGYKNNAYLIEVEDFFGRPTHLHSLNGQSRAKVALQLIYKKLGLPYSGERDEYSDLINLDDYQPSAAEVEDRIKHDNKQEKIQNIIDGVAAVAMTAMVIYATVKAVRWARKKIKARKS